MSTKINIDKKLIEAEDPIKEFENRLEKYFGTKSHPKTPSVYGAKKNQCMKWVRLQMDKLGFPIDTSQQTSLNAWEFYAGLADTSKSGFGLVPNVGKAYNQDEGGMSRTKFNAIIKEMGIPDGAIIFGHSKNSSYWKESLDSNKKISVNKEVRKKMKEFTTLLAKQKLGEEAENTATHIGIWKNGEYYHNVQNCKYAPACGCKTLAVSGCYSSWRMTAWWPFEDIVRKKLNSL